MTDETETDQFQEKRPTRDRLRTAWSEARSAISDWYETRPLWVQYTVTGGGSIISYLSLNWLYSSLFAPQMAVAVDSGVEAVLPPYAHPILVTLNYAILAAVSYLAVHLTAKEGNSLS